MKENLDWAKLGFSYHKTPYNIRCYYRNGKWGELEIHSDETIPMHMAASCLHYGQEAFEGLKAYRCKDGKVRLFRVDENAKRMASSSEYLQMAVFPVERFIEAVHKVVELNAEYIPPYESGASLYIRPLLVGTGAQVGVKPADEYLFVVFVTPVGPYFKGDGEITMCLERKYDRAAPHGTGHIKAGGNYGASLTAYVESHDKGFDGVLYLDPKEKKYIDEVGAANFFGIKDGKYVTPDSPSILPSITNKSLCTIAGDMGLTVERRHVPLEELSTFEEAGACGTAAVITPINNIYDPEEDKTYRFKTGDDTWSHKLYRRLVDIQYGQAEDKFGWVTVLDNIR